MPRVILLFAATLVSACVVSTVVRAEEWGPRVVLKIRTEIELESRKSVQSSTIIYSPDEEDAPQIDIGDYDIHVLISDVHAYEVVIDLTLRGSAGTALTATQVLVPIGAEGGFNLSAPGVSVAGTIGIPQVIHPDRGEN